MNRQIMLAKCKLLVVAVCAVIVTFWVQPTQAYFSVVGRTTNVITTGSIDIQLIETFNDSIFPEEGVFIVPGSIINHKAFVQNTGKHPCWVRIKLDYDSPDGIPVQERFSPIINFDDWTEYEGFYYYNEILETDSCTMPLFQAVSVAGELSNDSYTGSLTMKIVAYAVQSEHNDQVSSALEVAGWPSEQEGEGE